MIRFTLILFTCFTTMIAYAANPNAQDIKNGIVSVMNQANVQQSQINQAMSSIEAACPGSDLVPAKAFCRCLSKKIVMNKLNDGTYYIHTECEPYVKPDH